MSQDMYDFIVQNKHRLKYDLENGLIITPKGTNGTICSSTGYLRVKVNKRLLQVHQILAVIYFGNKVIGMQINHIDGNKLNNKIDNLEVVTQLENIKHEFESGLCNIKKKIDQLTLDGKFLKTFNSIKEASMSLGQKSTSSISKCLRGHKNSACGYKWRYTIKHNT